MSLGASAGASMALLYESLDHQNTVDGVVLVNPSVLLAKDVSDSQIKLAKWIGKITPKLPVRRLRSIDDLSSVHAEQQSFLDDKLVYSGAMDARTANEIIQIHQQTEKTLKLFSTPALIMQSGCDRLVNPQGSELCYHDIQSSDKTLCYYKDARHDLLHDTMAIEAFDDIVFWLNKRVVEGYGQVLDYGMVG